MAKRKHWLPVVWCLGIILAVSPAPSSGQDSAVSIREEPLVIPTYQVGESDRNPIFYGGRAYQGARGAVYPYPLMDQLTDVRENKTYRAVTLENKYIKISVLPEIGGRILSALDKTDGYDFFYHQHVIKPALIGMLGAWISGGVEWNLPHHHRATTFMPVDYVLEENSDGSKTVWVGETELRHRMKWLIGLTLHPDRDYIELTGKLINRTPVAHSFLYFANVAVHANENYQVIFPPSTVYGTYHGKNQFLPWPISSRDFNGLDFGHDVDVSWWKNHPSPTSWFAFDCQEDFFGGYDHGKRAGVAHVADHHIVPGKKFWEFANGDVGRMWDKILTETDGPYVELMVGAYSDNQPDYSWIQPYEVKTWKQYWYPLREIGGMKNANTEAAVNLEVGENGTASIGVNTTTERPQARIVLRSGDKILWEERASIGPAEPFVKDVALPAGVKEEDLQLAVISSDEQELISYRPRKYERGPSPETAKPPLPPEKIKTIEELYLTGLRLEQFYSPALEGYPYFEEALRRNPGDARVNTTLGRLYCERGMFKEAEERLEVAIQRLTHDYTRPKNGEPFYYLGVALSGQGKDAAAYDAFYNATWSQAWTGAAYYHLARLDCRRQEWAKALEHLERALAANAWNSSALHLKAAVLRHMGKPAEAEKVLSTLLAGDPLDFMAGNELYLAQSAAGRSSEAASRLEFLNAKMRREPQSYLEVAAEYGNGGLRDEAIQVLERFVGNSPKAAKINPMIFYYLADFSAKQGNEEEASRFYRAAAHASPDYCFPFRLESVGVLERAIARSPGDVRAHYFLGNLLYDRQPEKAIRAWEESRRLDNSFPTVHRNLGFAYARVEKNLPKAMASLERALELSPSDGRVLFELDQLSEWAGVLPEKRLARLEGDLETVLKRDDATSQLISLELELGEYDKAIDLLSRRHFHVWEGGGEIHNAYVDAHLLRGQRRLEAKQPRGALEDFRAALEYPENLEVGKPYGGGREAEVSYFIGLAQEGLGDSAAARSSFEKCAAAKQRNPEIRYYQALALRRLGKESEAKRILADLVAQGERELKVGALPDYFAKFGEAQSEGLRAAQAHYLIGLGLLGQGKREEARREFQQAVEKNVNHLGARTQLAALK
jgi:tetratricopeptide (TPR) repeat protein